jgi:hypothetical protein
MKGPVIYHTSTIHHHIITHITRTHIAANMPDFYDLETFLQCCSSQGGPAASFAREFSRICEGSGADEPYSVSLESVRVDGETLTVQGEVSQARKAKIWVSKEFNTGMTDEVAQKFRDSTQGEGGTEFRNAVLKYFVPGKKGQQPFSVPWKL